MYMRLEWLAWCAHGGKVVISEGLETGPLVLGDVHGSPL